MCFCQHRSVQTSPRRCFLLLPWVGGNFLRASSPCYGLISAVRRDVPWQFFFLKLRPFESSWQDPANRSKRPQKGKDRNSKHPFFRCGALAVSFREGYSKLLLNPRDWLNCPDGIHYMARPGTCSKVCDFFWNHHTTGAITGIFATVWWNAVLGRIQLSIEYTMENEHGTKKITPFKMKFIFQTSILGSILIFQGVDRFFMSVARSNPGSEDHDKTISEDEWVWALRCVCSVFSLIRTISYTVIQSSF